MHWSWNDNWSGWNWAMMMIGMIAFWGSWLGRSWLSSARRTGHEAAGTIRQRRFSPHGLRPVRSKTTSIGSGWICCGRARFQRARNRERQRLTKNRTT